MRRYCASKSTRQNDKDKKKWKRRKGDKRNKVKMKNIKFHR